MGLVKIGPEAFARMRKAAEDMARFHVSGGEPLIDEIYSTLRGMLGLSEEVSKLILNEELRIESELIRPLPRAQAIIDDAVAVSGELVFLSDMYLSSAFLRDQIGNFFAPKVPVSVLVSGECRGSKRTGELFRRLLVSRNARPEDLIHFGNDPVGDDVVPARMGIRTRLFSDWQLNRFESILEDHRWESAGLTSLFAGAARMARLTVHAGDPREAAIRDVAAGVAAPALASYVMWVLRRASALGLQRLYFVSRDGELLLEIAAELARKLAIGIELRYLYGSRQAWHLPAYGLSPRPEEEWVFDSIGSRMSVELILFKLGLPADVVEAPLARLGFPRATWKLNLSSNDRGLLRLALKDEEMVGHIMSSAREAREMMLRYLRQEGLMDAIPFGVVDLGWTGRMFESLWTVLREERAQPPHGFLFGWRPAASYLGSMPIEGYFFDTASRTGYPNFGAAELFELFCAGSHGMVIGYRGDHGRIVPILRETVNERARAWGLPLLRSTIRTFFGSFYMNGRDDFSAVDARPAVYSALSEFVNHPTYSEASAWGAFQHPQDQTELVDAPLAHPYSVRHALRRLMGRPFDSDVRWAAASMAITSLAIRALLRGAGLTRRIARRLACLADWGSVVASGPGSVADSKPIGTASARQDR